MSIENLKIESYSSTVSERELTEVKGGSTWWCVASGVIVAIGTIIGGSGGDDGDGGGDPPATPDTPDPPQN